jgi:hypothetical protein
MAQIERGLYKSIVDAYAAIDTNLVGVSTDARTALNAIVNVGTTNYPDSTPSVQDPDAALEIELALLGPFNIAFVSAGNMASSVAFLLDAVRAVNNHIVANATNTADTAKVKLDNFINNDMGTTWTNDCPVGWANLSTDAGYDTTDWTTSTT